MIRTPTRAGRDRQLWNGRHFFWPDCCCKSPPSSPDGIVWFAGRLYPTYEVRARVRSTGAADSGYLDSGTLGKCLRVGPDGDLWAIINTTIRRIDIDTMSEVWSADADWRDQYGGESCAFALDASGNSYVAVGRYSAALKLRVYDADGAQQSEFDLNDDDATGIAVDLDGNIFVACKALTAFSERALVKYDSDGVEVWAIDTLDSTNAGCATDADGNVYLASGQSGLNGYLKKYDPDGNELWSVGGSTNIPYRVCIDDSGDPYALCMSTSTSGAKVRKFAAADGALQWSTTVDGDAMEMGDICYADGRVFCGVGLGGFGSFPDTANALAASDGTKEWGQDIDTACYGVAAAPGLAPHFQ